MAICACNFKSIKTVHFAQANVFLHVFDFASDDVKGFVKVKAKGGLKIRGWFDVINPFPTIHDGKFCAFGGQDRC